MDLKKEIINQRNNLQEILDMCNKRIECAPAGSLRISINGKHIKYYQYGVNNKSSGQYISTKNKELICLLAQKDYDKKVCKFLQEKIEKLNCFLYEYNDDPIDNLIKKEHIARQKYITPIEVPWEQYVETWLNEPYTKKIIEDGTYIIKTDKGDVVRSKSEKIIADYLFHNNIPYKYEKALILKGSKIFYPDFTILSSKTKQEKYWEHFGMMDNPDYVKKALFKQQVYQENGIFEGDLLIATYEVRDKMISRENVVRLVERYL